MRQWLSGQTATQDIEQWGHSRQLRGPWVAGQARTVLQHKPPRREDGAYCVPTAQSMMLSAAITPQFVNEANWAFRWAVTVGGGGGSQRVVFDATNLQQVAIAAENLTVDFLVEASNVDPTVVYTPPSVVSVAIGVSFADGNVSSEQCTYTQNFALAAGSPTQLQVPIPSMAIGFRVSGDRTAPTTPFNASALYSISGPGPWTVTGADLAAHAADNSYMLIGGAGNGLVLTNTDGAHQMIGRLIWILDI